MSEEILIPARRGEWTIMPQRVCRVSGTVFHETCVLGDGRTEYPCCDLVILTESIDPRH